MNTLKMRNKAGKMGTGFKWLLGVSVALIAIVLVYGVSQSTAPVEPTVGGGGVCADSSSILTISDYSALTGGTDPGSPTYTAGIVQEGQNADSTIVATSVTSGTTKFPVNSEVVLIAVIDDYIDEKFVINSMDCGGQTLLAPLKYSTSDNPSIRMISDEGDYMADALGDSTATNNQTALTAGEAVSWDVEFQGTNGEASGEGVWVIEFPASSSANITSVTLDGSSPISIPSIHTLQNTASEAVAFNVPSVEGATKNTMTVTVQLATGKVLEGGVRTDWYAKQWFIDDDKTLAYGIQDSDGDAKYENTLDYDFGITF